MGGTMQTMLIISCCMVLVLFLFPFIYIYLITGLFVNKAKKLSEDEKLKDQGKKLKDQGKKLMEQLSSKLKNEGENSNEVCNAGQKYDENSGSCVPCGNGTYQDDPFHSYTECKNHPSLDDLKLNTDACNEGSYFDETKYVKVTTENKSTPVKSSDLCSPNP